MPMNFDDFKKPLPGKPGENSRDIDEVIIQSKSHTARDSEDTRRIDEGIRETAFGRRGKEKLPNLDEALARYKKEEARREQESLGGNFLKHEDELSPEEKWVKRFIEATYRGTKRPDVISVSEVRPKDQDWRELESNNEPQNFGEGTINPESRLVNLEASEVLVPDLSLLVGQKMTIVAEFLIRTYGDRYYLPGIDYFEWMLKVGKSRHHWLKDDLHYYFFGSTLRDFTGDWGIPAVSYSSDALWGQQIIKLGTTWRHNFRVVLVKK